MLQWFGLANPRKRVSHDRFSQIQNLYGHPMIGLRPKAKVFSELRLKDATPVSGFSQGQPLPANQRLIGSGWFVVARALMPPISVPR